jgi:hypothetical protein
MGKRDLLTRMKQNPQGDWTISDVSSVCKDVGVACDAPKRGDHYKVSHQTQIEILTIPARRPIKPIYIRKLVTFIDSVLNTQG